MGLGFLRGRGRGNGGGCGREVRKKSQNWVRKCTGENQGVRSD